MEMSTAFQVIDQWDNLQTIEKIMQAGTGPGGNNKTGEFCKGFVDLKALRAYFRHLLVR